MRAVAWALVIMAAIDVVWGPFLIGKERGTYTGTTYLSELVVAAWTVALAGHVLGWW